MTGEDILKRYEDGTLVFRTMGRSGGSAGADLTQDLASGKWRRQLYELNKGAQLANRNWFAIKDFIARVRQNRPD